MLELLAPCGDEKSFDAAISCGADAVYLGLENFNARMRAQNFDTQNIARYVHKAHLYGVKVYLAINTILHNDEFKQLFDIVKAAIDAKIDGYIVQDLGVCRALKNRFDGIRLHASTQLGVHNLYGAQLAQKAGFSRIVLSRETKLEDIRDIYKNTSLELEFFVQGALCISFSGNCYLSAVEQDASGNRGMCKQLCRLPYQIQGSDRGGYLLSARDLCLADSLRELIDAGISSFKIEGRMRGEGYVAQTVSVYRNLLDGVAKGRKLNETQLIGLKKVYNRGDYLTRSYLDKEMPKVVDIRYNNHIGVKIGRVESVKPFKENLFEIVISCAHTLKKGDGLKFFDNEVERASLGVGEAMPIGKGKFRVITKTKVKQGWQVSLISDAALESNLLQIKRFLPINIKVTAICGKPLHLEAEYTTCEGTRICADMFSQQPLEPARTAPSDEQEIATQCSKTADSGFEVCDCRVTTNGVFVAKSAINALRRQLLEILAEKIIRHNEKDLQVVDTCNIQNNDVETSKRLYRVIRAEESGSLILKKGEVAVLAPYSYDAKSIVDALKRLDLSVDEIALQLPVIANGADIAIIENLLKALPNIKTLVSENLYGLFFSKCGYSVIAGAGHNAANSYAVQALKDLGASDVIASIEAQQDFASKLSESIAELPLMSFAHCPYKTITDKSCESCGYKGEIILKRGRQSYRLRRVRVSQCYFGLYSTD